MKVQSTHAFAFAVDAGMLAMFVDGAGGAEARG
jgi:hypothetical protein